MRRSALALLGLAVVACGPFIVDVADDGSTTGIASASFETGIESSGVGPSAEFGTEASGDDPISGTDAATTLFPEVSTGGEVDEGDFPSTGEAMCGCPDPTPLAIDVPSDAGVQADEIFTRIGATTSYAWTWNAVEDRPTTTMQLGFVYEGGDVLQWTGVDPCGGAFIDVPCPQSTVVDVRLTASTADGLFATELPAVVQITEEGAFVELATGSTAASEIVGTLLSQMLSVDGEPILVDTFEVGANWVISAGNVISSDAEIVGGGALLGAGGRME